MPARARPDDWDRLFGSNAPRRGGPLRVLATLLSLGLALSLLLAGGFFGLRYRAQIQAEGAANATAIAQVLATRTAVAQQTATARALAAATPVPAAAEATLGVGRVLPPGGNLRSEPRIAPETVVGLIYPDDRVVLLEERLVDNTPWFRIRLSEPGSAPRDGGVGPGTEGWASGTLLARE